MHDSWCRESQTTLAKVDNEANALKKALIENSEFGFKNILNQDDKGCIGCEQLKNIMENQQDISEPLVESRIIHSKVL